MSSARDAGSRGFPVEELDGLLSSHSASFSSPEMRPSLAHSSLKAAVNGPPFSLTSSQTSLRALLCCLALAASLLSLAVLASHRSAMRGWPWPQRAVDGVDGVEAAGGPSLSSSLPPLQRGRSLVVYVHYAAELHYVLNLDYFIARAVRCWQDADYVFVIQSDHARAWDGQPNNRSWADGLPALPANGRYVLHQNECFDWGTVGWLLTLPQGHPDAVDTSRYRYFILMNSSVRGPFFPRWVEEQMDPSQSVECSAAAADADAGAADRWRSPSSSPPPPALFTWYHVLLGLLSADVRYAGCTVNCLFYPHVQSYVVATDFVGLQVLWQADGLLNVTRPIALIREWAEWQALAGGVQSLPLTGSVFLCPTSYWNAIEHELGASQAMLKAGFNFAVLMRFWQGVDFRTLPEPCSQLRLKPVQMDPTSQGVPRFRMQEVGPDNPMTPLEPLEVVFVKHKKREPHPSDNRTDSLIEWDHRAQLTQLWQADHTDRTQVVYPGNLSLET